MVLQPLRKTITVPCSQREAFNIFVHEMDSWWPMDQFTTTAFTGQTAQAIRVQAAVGGAIIEVGPDDTEYTWGTIQTYRPPEFIRMEFHIPHPTEVVHDRSIVEVRFTALDEDQTHVKLTQRNWEAFGQRAKDLYGGYGSGWDTILKTAFKTACTT